MRAGLGLVFLSVAAISGTSEAQTFAHPLVLDVTVETLPERWGFRCGVLATATVVRHRVDRVVEGRLDAPVVHAIHMCAGPGLFQRGEHLRVRLRATRHPLASIFDDFEGSPGPRLWVMSFRRLTSP
jgi:hypothetical protein